VKGGEEFWDYEMFVIKAMIDIRLEDDLALEYAIREEAK
jgi:hypothetical protein